MKAAIAFLSILLFCFTSHVRSDDADVEYSKIHPDCLQPKKIGPCEGHFRRFFFNMKTFKCERFFYGGCDANTNNFKTKAACSRHCHRSSSSGADPDNIHPDCQLPKKTGLCKAYIPRFFFNTSSYKCERFIYGGCQANANNFKTVAACMDHCRMAKSTFSDSFFNVDLHPDCQHPKETGRCKAYFRRFFFNTTSYKCERFVYGGCHGNANNFPTLATCMNRCQKPDDEENDQSVCHQRLDAGPCHRSFRRYYFDSTERKCYRFYYGGCQGNQNNFRTRRACERECIDKEPEEFFEERYNDHHLNNS